MSFTPLENLVIDFGAKVKDEQGMARSKFFSTFSYLYERYAVNFVVIILISKLAKFSVHSFFLTNIYSKILHLFF